MSTRAVVAKRGKCIVITTGHYSDAKYERIFFKSKSSSLECSQYLEGALAGERVQASSFSFPADATTYTPLFHIMKVTQFSEL